MIITSFKSRTIPSDRLLPGIHGLRGIAALAVVLFHLTHLTKIAIPQSFSFIGSDFGYGVHLFFVLSAFSLMHSTEHTLSRPAWCAEYLVKRFWRIAPLFYFVLTVEIFRRMAAGQWISAETLLMNLTFSFGAAPWTGIVMAGWTVGVEVLFYILLPVLLMVIRSNAAYIWLVVISIPVSMTLRSVWQVHYENTLSLYGWNWSYFSFGANLCFFAMGMYAFHLARILKPDEWVSRRGVPLFAVMLLGILMLTKLDMPLREIGRADLVLWGFGFLALTVWQGVIPHRWCANTFFEYVGERSYSVYLLHPIVLIGLRKPIKGLYAFLDPYMGSYAYFVCAAAVILVLLILSEMTYRWIEIPGIRYGQRINQRLRAGNKASEAHTEIALNN